MPPAGSPAFHAFRAFRNYDGKGGRFLDTSIGARSAEASVSIFASRDAEKIVAVLLNLDAGSAAGARIDAQSCGTVAGRRVFVYAGGPEGLREQPSNGNVTLPAYSMTVVELGLAAK
jgi:hypothetical protein